MPIVSLGLANFYAQLNNREARAYITKKLELLEKYVCGMPHVAALVIDPNSLFDIAGNEIWP